MHLFHIPQCTIQYRNVHISVLNGALWDMEQGLRDKLAVTQVPCKAQDWASKSLATTAATTSFVPYVYIKSQQLGRISGPGISRFPHRMWQIEIFYELIVFWNRTDETHSTNTVDNDSLKYSQVSIYRGP